MTRPLAPARGSGHNRLGGERTHPRRTLVRLGMAATDPTPRSDRPLQGGVECLTPVALRDRLEEEISRAERHGTLLSCLLVVIEDLDEMTREHGSALREQTIEYVA